MRLPLTPAQTVGPFLSIGLGWDAGADVVPDDAPGAVWLAGTVYDGAGEPVPDALVETWQADGAGGFAPSPGHRGFGRCATDRSGRWRVRTVKPGVVRSPDGSAQAPHIDVSLFARGLLDRVVTRVYFADEDDANAADPVLASVPADRRATLLATPVDGGYAFDIHLQGEAETVFFDI